MFVRVTSGCSFAKLTSAWPPIQPEFNFSTNDTLKYDIEWRNGYVRQL